MRETKSKKTHYNMKKLLSTVVTLVSPLILSLNSVYTIQLVVKPVVQPVGQPAASCK